MFKEFHNLQVTNLLSGSAIQNQLNRAIEDYYSTLKHLNTSFLSSSLKKEGALEFVRVSKLLQVLHKVPLSLHYVDLLSKHLRSTIYYVEAKHQQWGIRFNVIFLASGSTLIAILILLFFFTVWYDRRAKKRKAMIKRTRQVQLGIDNLTRNLKMKYGEQ
jgi:hypothetical protein